MDLKTVEPFIPFIVSVLSILILAFGTVRFLILPLVKYRRIKKNIVSGMIGFLETIKPEDEIDQQTKEPERIIPIVQGCRTLSHELEKFYRMEIPSWYRSILRARGEFPKDAAVHLEGLSLASDYEHAWCRIKKVAKALKI